MRCLGWRNRAQQVASRIGLAQAFLDTVAKHSADLATEAVGGETRAARIDTLQRLEDFRSFDLSDWAFAEPREGVILEARRRLVVLRRLNLWAALLHPCQRDCLEGVDRCQARSALVGLLRLARIDARRQLFPRLVALLACSR